MSAAPTVESDEPAENAWRFQQALGKPSGFPTAPTASTTGPWSSCAKRRHKPH